MQSDRVKVIIRCRRCGEKFFLRGRRERGRVETGFKQCLCENQNDFDIEIC
ncbi:hypothetical protein GCM10027018_09800 [Paenibacillus thermoaerophilus]|jgi:DNA-directed RNA polymerase subunit RPC12/RpoP